MKNIKRNKNIVLSYIDGGSFVKQPPVLCNDAENVLICCKNSILKYSTKTGKLIHKFKGESDIVGFGCHIYDSHECLISCFDSGIMKVWKVTTHFKVFEMRLPIKKIKKMIIVPSKDLHVLVAFEDENDTRFAIINIKEKRSNCYSFSIPSKDSFYWDVGKGYFSLVSGYKIFFFKLDDFEKISRSLMTKTRNFTCIACHPYQEAVLTGDDLGRVTVWQNIFAYKQQVQNVFHWHTLPVKCVGFSPAGSYFYSGGGECVLVKWQLDNPLERKFLPRLSAALLHVVVSSNNNVVAISTEDNAIRILDSYLNQVALVQHLVLGNHYDSGIILDPRTKALVMNGTDGQLQFYSPRDKNLLYTLDIVGQNKITDERDTIMENTQIKKVAMNRNGNWLATIEERNDKLYFEIRLKFWAFNEQLQTFQLNTSIEYPHDGSVNSLLFQHLANDNNLRCVTVGNDTKFKVWQLFEMSTIYKKGAAWKCSSVGFYRGYPCYGVAFSIDGSLMAVGFDNILTVWSPETCELKCSLVKFRSKQKILQINFGTGNQCHLLVAANEDNLCVWNLLTLTMAWTVPLKVSILVADPLSTNMAAITDTGKVFVFSPASPDPIYLGHGLLKANRVIAAAFIPGENHSDARLNWCKRSKLYFIANKNELMCTSSHTSDSETPSDLAFDDEDATQTLYEKMLPNFKVSNVRLAPVKKQYFEKDLGRNTIKKYLEAPIHTMAPIRLSCRSLLSSLVIQK